MTDPRERYREVVADAQLKMSATIGAFVDRYGRCSDSICGMIFELCAQSIDPCCDRCEHPPVDGLCTRTDTHSSHGTCEGLRAHPKTMIGRQFRRDK